MDQRKRPTIRDVAAAAGVSRGTVSRALNGDRWVSPAAMTAVERAIKETGYRVNQHARSLATGRANSLAFLLTEPQHLLFADPNFALLLRGAADALAQRGQTLIMLVAGTEAERAHVVSYLAAGHVDGVLLISSHENEPLVESLLAEQIPVVACGIPLGHARDVAWVSVDEEHAARTMVAHLRSRGRSRVACIAGPLDTPGGRYRLDGYRAEVADLGLGEELIAYGDYSAASGRRAMAELLERVPDLDAVFAANDLMATGALSTLREAGRRVPEDVAVGGFDDTGPAAETDPPLTTMRQPFAAISAEMVSVLLGMVDGAGPKFVTLPAELVVRRSA